MLTLLLFIMLPRLLLHVMIENLIDMSQATTDYTITVSQEYANQFWKKELTQVVYELYPTIMETLKLINFKVRK